MTPRRLLLAASLATLVAVFGPTLAHAEGTDAELGIWLSREDAARLAGQAAQVPALREQVKALEAEASELRAGRDAALRLVEITERVVAAEQRLRHLAEEERDVYKERAERAEADRTKGRLWLTVQARGALGAALGTPFGLPGIAIGAAAGGLAGAIEAWVSGP